MNYRCVKVCTYQEHHAINSWCQRNIGANNFTVYEESSVFGIRATDNAIIMTYVWSFNDQENFTAFSLAWADFN